MRVPPLSAKLALILIAALTLVGGVLRVHRSLTPPPRISADQISYTSIAGYLRRDHTYGDIRTGDPLHWSPGEPVFVAVASKLAGAKVPARTSDVKAARVATALLGAATIPAVAWLAFLLAGWWAALPAAAALALYPASLPASQVLVSEPIGAFTLCLAGALLILAMQRKRLGLFALAGAAFGVAALCRPDVAPVGALGLLVAGGLSAASWRGRALTVGAAALGMILAIAPWTAIASHEAGKLVPITRGSNTALLMGTYVNGDGSASGLKYDQANRVRLRYARLAGTKTWRLPGAEVIDTLLAQRHGDRDARVSAQVHSNVKHCLLHAQLRCAEMQVRKLGRMWGGPFSAGQRVGAFDRGYHIVLVLLGWLGLLIVVARTGNRPLGVILLILVAHTALNTLYVGEARHAYRAMPLLVAAGAAGWVLLAPQLVELVRGRVPARGPVVPAGAASAA